MSTHHLNIKLYLKFASSEVSPEIDFLGQWEKTPGKNMKTIHWEQSGAGLINTKVSGLKQGTGTGRLPCVSHNDWGELTTWRPPASADAALSAPADYM